MSPVTERAIVYHSVQWAVDNYLDHVETLLIALSQRELTQEQLDRFARLLQRAELVALRRAKQAQSATSTPSAAIETATGRSGAPARR